MILEFYRSMTLEIEKKNTFQGNRQNLLKTVKFYFESKRREGLQVSIHLIILKKERIQGWNFYFFARIILNILSSTTYKKELVTRHDVSTTFSFFFRPKSSELRLFVVESLSNLKNIKIRRNSSLKRGLTSNDVRCQMNP